MTEAQKKRFEDELAALRRMQAGTAFETHAELSCAITTLEWVLGYKRKPLSKVYGRE